MANPVPNNLALSVINTGDTAQSAPLRNNYAAIQTAVNELIACFSGGTANQLLQAVDSTDVQWATPPGAEIGYDQITASVNIVGTTSAAPTTVIAGSAHTFDGSPVMAEFFTSVVELPTVTGGSMNIGLYEGSTLIAILATLENNGTAAVWTPAVGSFRFTPSAASHTYSIKAWVSSTTGTPLIFAQSGSANNVPAYLRFTKV